MLKYFLFNVLFLGLLLATPHEIFLEEDNQFMDGDFTEIKRFDKLYFTSSSFFSMASLTDESEEYFEKILQIVKKYNQDGKNIKLSIIGHSYARTDIHDKVDFDEEDYAESLEESKIYAQDIVKKFEENNISKEIISSAYRSSKDSGSVAAISQEEDLLNGVMVTMYVVAPIEKDSDTDGVFDSTDKCSDTPSGVHVDIEGCPLDSDNDGISDYVDNCIDTPIGEAIDDSGCPLDSDQDGILDYNDQCPNTHLGLKVDADGCTINRELRLNFRQKSSKISKEAYSQVIEFAEFLKDNPIYQVKIIGHTDSIGKAGYNMSLSFERAHALKNGLIAEGISEERLEAIGRGELSPIETNRTAAGRASNRRIEVKLFN